MSVCGCEEGENARVELLALKARIKEMADDWPENSQWAETEAAASAWDAATKQLRSLLNPNQTEPEAESIKEVFPGTLDRLDSLSVRGNQ